MNADHNTPRSPDPGQTGSGEISRGKANSESDSGANGHDLQRKILDTARRMLTSDGYESLSMRKIARSIGYSATSIYLHFDNKDQLVHALIDEGVDMLHDELRAVTRVERSDTPEKNGSDMPGAGPVGRILRLSKAYVKFGLNNREYYEIMYVLHPEYMERYPAEKYRKARRNLLFLADALEQAYDAGLVEPGDSLLAASIIWAQLHGMVSLLVSERIDKRVDADEFVEQGCKRIVMGFINSTREEISA